VHSAEIRRASKANPALRSARGVGVDVAAILLVAAGDNPERLRNESAFVALCGVSPVRAPSGLTVRHRLNRSGNRQANNELWRIAVVRTTHDEETRTYASRDWNGASITIGSSPSNTRRG
jgi:transposase